MTEPDSRDVDVRMSLAAERTYLAYLRTGLALVASGVAAVAAFPNASHEVLRRGIGIALVVLGGTVFAVARPRWKAIDQALRRGDSLPDATLARYLGPALVVIAAAAAVVVILT